MTSRQPRLLQQTIEAVLRPAAATVGEIRRHIPTVVDRTQQHLRNSRVIGRFTVDGAVRQIQSALDGNTRSGPDGASDAPTGDTLERDSSRDRPPAATADATHLAIPDYDSLAASQVVPRLRGLTAQERAEVREYEASTRNRRTILAAIDSLAE